MNRRHRLPILAAAVLLVPSLSGELAAEDAVRLRPLGGGLVAAPAEIAGERLSLLVDTGTTRSWVRSEVARRLDLKPRARYTVQTAAGTRAALCAGPVAVRFGGSDVVLDCLGWSDERDDRLLPAHLDGVLGADALTGRPLLLDVGRSRLIWARRRDVVGEEVALTLVEGRPAITLDVAAGPGQRSGSLLLVLDSAADQLVLFGRVAARRPRSGGDRLTTLAGSLAVAVGPPPRFAGIGRPPRRALLLTEVVDRREDGLLPLAAVDPVFFDWERGIAVLDARRRR